MAETAHQKSEEIRYFAYWTVFYASLTRKFMLRETATKQSKAGHGYHHATVKDAKEAGELIERCWQYICTTPQGIMLFRKAKKRNE